MHIILPLKQGHLTNQDNFGLKGVCIRDVLLYSVDHVRTYSARSDNVHIQKCSSSGEPGGVASAPMAY